MHFNELYKSMTLNHTLYQRTRKKKKKKKEKKEEEKTEGPEKRQSDGSESKMEDGGDSLQFLLVAYVTIMAMIILSCNDPEWKIKGSSFHTMTRAATPYIIYLAFIPKILSDAIFDYFHRECITIGRRMVSKDDMLLTLAPRQFDYNCNIANKYQRSYASRAMTLLFALLLLLIHGFDIIIIVPSIIISAYIVVLRTNLYPQILGFKIHFYAVIGNMVVHAILQAVHFVSIQIKDKHQVVIQGVKSSKGKAIESLQLTQLNTMIILFLDLS